MKICTFVKVQSIILVWAVHVSGSASSYDYQKRWQQALQLLVEAHQASYKGQSAIAIEKLEQLLSLPSIFPHHKEEALWLLARLKGQEEASAISTNIPLYRKINQIKAALFVYVDCKYEGRGDGSIERPFNSLEEAVDLIRSIKKEARWPEGGIRVIIKGGRYELRRPMILTEEHSGTEVSPLVFSGADGELAIITGSVLLKDFVAVEDAAILAQLPENARTNVVMVDLKRYGIREIAPLTLGGFGSGRGFQTYPVMELFWNGEALQLARWPNHTFARIDGVVDGEDSGKLIFKNPRITKWAKEPEGWLLGYWKWDWAESYEKIQSIDIDNALIILAPPLHRYGFKAKQPFYAINMLCELDMPGEWYIDRKNARLYLWPLGELKDAIVELSVKEGPFISLKGASYIFFENLILDGGVGDAIRVEGGSNCGFLGCTIRKFSGNGVVISGGTEHVVISSDIYNMGRGGIVVDGGDRKQLIPGSHIVENCHIYELSRIDHTYTPAVLISGVGHRVAHNLIHDVASSALRVGGNMHVIEYNEIFRVVTESDDQGAVDMWGDPTFRDIIYRFNYFHHIGGWEKPQTLVKLGRAGIRLDDAISGIIVYGNIFFRSSAGGHGFGAVQIHGGKENIIENNIFIDCMAAISLSPWSGDRWVEFVKGRLDKGDIDKSLYLKHYPELADLESNPNVNLIGRNIMIGCKDWILRDNKEQIQLYNWLGSENPGIEEVGAGSFIINSDSAKLASIGFYPIPFDRIGLYVDEYRKILAPQLLNIERGKGGPSSISKK